MLGELRAFNAYRRKDKRLFHYSVTGGFDVDFVVETQKKILNRPSRFIAIEAKAASHWRPEWSSPLHTLLGRDAVAAAYGVYLGKKPILMEGLTVLPFRDFSERLWAGEIF
jgi:hypothetical protein